LSKEPVLSLWGKIFGLEKNVEYENGIKHFNEGKYELAVEELERAIEKAGRSDPVHALGMFYAAESHAHIGTAKFHAGDFDGALEHFKKAVEENPTYPDLYYRMGVIYHRKNALDEAIDMLRNAIRLNESYFEAVCYLGIVHFEKGEKDEADALFHKALDIGADTPSPISKYLSDHLSGRESDIPPLTALKELMITDTDFDDLIKEGIEAFNTGNFETAVTVFGEAVRIHPDYADIRFKLGLSYLRKGEHEPARGELEAALSINPNYTEARFYLGIAFLDRKLYREALPHFERAVSERPGYADILCFLGATYFYLGELERAKEMLERSIELSPTYRKASFYYGLLLYTLEERQRAIEFLSEAIDGENVKSPANISLALVHLREDNLEEAMVVLHDILQAGGESADVLYFIGEVYLRMKKLEEAEVFFRRALDANPGFLRAREKLAHILIRKGDYDGAEHTLDSPGGDFADLYKIMGDIRFLKGDLKNAEDLYRKSLEVNAEYSEASLSLALTLRKEGLEGEAEGILQKLVELDPENILARNLLGRGPLDLDSR